MHLSGNKIKKDIMDVLRRQGYEITNGTIELRCSETKEDLRRANEMAVSYRIEKAKTSLRDHEEALLSYIADGSQVNPKEIKPRLLCVEGGSEESRLFYYVSLHWSVPVSAGYGRRLRFLIMDETNGKLIGILGLGDPVYSIRKRDAFIGWDSETKKDKLYHVMGAHVLGAVPPYSTLLCGKLVALLCLSNEIRQAFRRKYVNRKSLINKRVRVPWLVMVTTTSALGRSSIYNRIKMNGQEYWRSLGFTQGSGEVQFYNGVYESIREYAEHFCKPTAKQKAWGKGFRNKREVVKKCLSEIGLSTRLLYHGIQREIYVAPLGRNALRFLRGETERPCFYDWPAEELSRKFLERWLVPRATRIPEYRDFRHEKYRLWGESGGVLK